MRAVKSTNHHRKSVQRAPDDKHPARSVPESAQQKHRKNVSVSAVFALAVAA